MLSSMGKNKLRKCKWVFFDREKGATNCGGSDDAIVDDHDDNDDDHNAKDS